MQRTVAVLLAIIILIVCFCSGGCSARPPALPLDPLLAAQGAPLPSVPDPVQLSRGPSSVVTEGIPPVPTRLVEKIRRWEFVDLIQLIEGPDPNESSSDSHSGTSSKSSKKSTITDLATWLQAYARLMAVLLSASTTSKEEAAGLAAHLHVILQVAQDLGGRHWLMYDVEYREWAAAKGIRVWGELNLHLYGRCLARPSFSTYSNPPDLLAASTPICFKWNSGNCQRPQCRYLHICLECRGPHPKIHCNLKRPSGKK